MPCLDKVALPVLRNVSLDVKEGQLTVICGAVGSGKSSLLAAIMGELVLVSGHAALSPKIKGDGFGYVAQEAWIQVSVLGQIFLIFLPCLGESPRRRIN